MLIYNKHGTIYFVVFLQQEEIRIPYVCTIELLQIRIL